jgi:peroxiredoxin
LVRLRRTKTPKISRKKAGEMDEIRVGTVAPDFKLPSASGSEVALSDYHGRMAVVLFFVREFN